MSERPIIVVSGFGRCGSSLVMQMLAAGGVPCLGDYPAFESRAMAKSGEAIKILDPHRANPTPYAIPPGACVIWLDRDPSEQADSLVKFTRILMGFSYNREQRRALVRQLRADREQAMRAIGTRPKMIVPFESLLSTPAAWAKSIGAFVGLDGFDIIAAAGQVRLRSPKCASGLDMELDLMGSRGNTTTTRDAPCQPAT